MEKDGMETQKNMNMVNENLKENIYLEKEMNKIF